MKTVKPNPEQTDQGVHGDPIPDHTTPRFDRMGKQLREMAPESASRIIAGSGTEPHVTLPSEVFVSKLRRRRLLRSILTKCVYKRAWPGELVLDKRRIVGVALIVFTGAFLPAIYMLNRAATSRSGGASPLVPSPAVASTTQPGPVATRRPLRQEVELHDARTLQRSLPTPPPAPIPAANQLSGLVHVPPPPVYSVPRISPPPWGPVPTIPDSRVQQNSATGGAPRVFSFVAPDNHSPNSRIFAFSQPETPSGGSPSIAQRPEAHTVGQPVDESLLRWDDASTSLSKAALLFVRPGRIIGARLITGLALSAGLEPNPVLAVSEGARWCGSDGCPEATWLGQATYVGGHRVQIKISAALVAGHTYPVQARALGADMIVGVPASISSRTPTVAAQIITAALAAARDYFRALGEQRQVTITSEWFSVAQTSNPDFFAQLLSRITEVIPMPNRQATVDIAEVAPGTELRILVQGAQGR